MTPQELKDLLERAAEAVSDYYTAIDCHLYKLGYFMVQKEGKMRALADELEQAARQIDLPEE